MLEASPDEPERARTVSVLLLAGDLSALLAFVVLGRLSHGLTTDWLANTVRIATPFLLSWLAVGFVGGLFRSEASPTSFLLRSFVGLVVADLIALVLRVVLFGDRVTIPFALTTVAFTVLLVLSWRLLFYLFRGRRVLAPQHTEMDLANESDR